MPSPVETPGPGTRPAEPAQRRPPRFEVHLSARCEFRESDGTAPSLTGRTRNLGEGVVLLLLPRAVPEGTQVTIHLDTPSGPAVRQGRVILAGPQETTDLGGVVFPHEIAFAQPLERAFVEAAAASHEPRRSPRAPVEVEVAYEKAVGDRSLNLSRSGIFIQTGTPLPVNEPLTLRFRLPGVAGEFQIRGKVIWSNTDPNGPNPQGMGIRFVRLPREQADQIAAFVSRVRRERGLDRLTDLFRETRERQERKGDGG